MEVSHFELVYKPQSPAGPADTVLQGYFLEISNLEPVQYLYRLRFVTSPIADPNRSLFGNTSVFVDTPGTNNNIGLFSFNGALNSKTFTLNRLITIPPHGTALVAVLPSDPFTAPGAPPNFECRGYVELTLPPLFQFSGNFGILRPQAEAPVTVMLTPQNRATYLSAAGVINDQTQSSVPVASGKAVNELPPEPAILFPAFPLTSDLDVSRINDLISSVDLTPEMLTAMVAQVGDDPEAIKAVNEVLAKAGLNVELGVTRDAKTRSRSDKAKEAVS